MKNLHGKYKKVKVLVVNTSDINGGAARAAYRLHKSLLSQKVDSQMLVQTKNSDDFTIQELGSSKLKQGLYRLRPPLDRIPASFYKSKTKALFSSSWFGFSNIIDKINEINPDIVHLHWICGGMLKIEDIAKIKAPIVWSFHDMWAFTGGCHYSDTCMKYEKECGTCAELGSNKHKDLSFKNFYRKQKIFSQIENMTIVGLSQWLTTCSQNSFLLKDKRHVTLPNPIDTNVFKPLDKEITRDLWNLPKDKKLILFGATNATSDARKGFHKLHKALSKIEVEDIELVIYGSSVPKKSFEFGFTTHYVGILSDDISLITLYSAVDVMVVPSLQENLSNAILESLSCATPVVGFNIGGNGDMIEHKNTGYLAEPLNTNDLANGVIWTLNNEKYKDLSNNARNKVLREFDSKIVSQKYIKLYKEIIHGK